MLRLTRRGLETGHSGTAPVLDPTSEGLRVKSPRSTQPYIRMKAGFMYLVAVMDWFSRYVLSWRISNSLDTLFCIEALEEALVKRKPDIFNSDQGSQFTSDEFISAVQARGIRISMDGRGRAMDNIMIERLWRSVKYEEVYLKDYQTVRDVLDGLYGYFRFYNSERPHQSFGYRTPASMYFGS